MTLEPIKQQA